jgi:hypothetical protein
MEWCRRHACGIGSYKDRGRQLEMASMQGSTASRAGGAKTGSSNWPRLTGLMHTARGVTQTNSHGPSLR